jgi:hypothetical protein
MGYPTLGVADPAKLYVNPFLLFQKSKSISSASQKIMGYPTLGVADPAKLYVKRFSSFPEKKQKH